MIQPGTKLADYEVGSAIGKGGMGEGWRARDTKPGREVAIKTFPDEFARDYEWFARFNDDPKRRWKRRCRKMTTKGAFKSRAVRNLSLLDL